jgi:hypothetical protein
MGHALLPSPIRGSMEPTRRESYTDINIDYELTDLPITALGGLPVIVEAAKALGIDRLFDKQLNIKLRKRGYTEYELALAVIPTLLAGASCKRNPLRTGCIDGEPIGQ